jgi:hypothetical protein
MMHVLGELEEAPAISDFSVGNLEIMMLANCKHSPL